jgi:nucleotide-binding universal stress UspA family protein
MIPFQKILCPTDFSEPSCEAIKAANELALHFAAELSIVNVVAPIPTLDVPASVPAGGFNIAQYEQELEDSAKRAIHKIVDEKISKEVSVHPIVVVGEAAHQIVQIAEETEADLIVIATHGRTGWRRFLFGSVAERVVRLATCPVLTIQAPHDTA